MNGIDICNKALLALGNTMKIYNFAEQTTQAEVCGLLYDTTRKTLLKNFPWKFAMRIVPLTLSASDTDAEFQYVYEMPSDALRVLAVQPEGRVTDVPYEFDERPFADTDGNMVLRIVTDVQTAYCKYIYDVADENLYPPEFVKALSLVLASELAMPLSTSAQVVQIVSQQAQASLDYARRMCSLEQRLDVLPGTTYNQARF